MPQVGDVRPWTDPVAVRTKGRTTTTLDGVVRRWIDAVAIRTQGRVTTYSPEELGSATVFITGTAQNTISLTGQANNIIGITGVVEA